MPGDEDKGLLQSLHDNVLKPAAKNVTYGLGAAAELTGATDHGYALKSFSGLPFERATDAPPDPVLNKAQQAQYHAEQQAERARLDQRTAELADGYETAAVTVVQTTGAAAGGTAGFVAGGPPGAATGAAVGWDLAEDGANAYMQEFEGRKAQLRSLRAAYSPIGENQDLGTVGNFVVDYVPYVLPVPELRNDGHYAAGGSVATHPDNFLTPQQLAEKRAGVHVPQSAPSARERAEAAYTGATGMEPSKHDGGFLGKLGAFFKDMFAILGQWVTKAIKFVTGNKEEVPTVTVPTTPSAGTQAAAPNSYTTINAPSTPYVNGPGVSFTR